MIKSLPEVLDLYIMDFVNEKLEENETNSSIESKVRNLASLELVSKKMYMVFHGRIELFKDQHSANIKAVADKYPPLVGMFPPLIEAALYSDVDRFTALLGVEQDVNRQDQFGRTALHISAGFNGGQGKIEYVRLLLQHPRLDPFKLTLKGETARDLTSNPEIMDLLKG
jgi:ankyrin repeat protein